MCFGNSICLSSSSSSSSSSCPWFSDEAVENVSKHAFSIFRAGTLRTPGWPPHSNVEQGSCATPTVDQEVLKRKYQQQKKRPCQRRPLHSSNGRHRACFHPRFIRSKQADCISRLKCHHHLMWHRRIGLSVLPRRAGQRERKQSEKRLVEAEAPMERRRSSTKSMDTTSCANTRFASGRLASAINHELQMEKKLDPTRSMAPTLPRKIAVSSPQRLRVGKPISKLRRGSGG